MSAFVSPIARESFREFKNYIDSLPDSAFRPKPGDNRYRRTPAPLKSRNCSSASADRARNELIFVHQKVATIRAARAKQKETSPAI